MLPPRLPPFPAHPPTQHTHTRSPLSCPPNPLCHLTHPPPGGRHAPRPRRALLQRGARLARRPPVPPGGAPRAHVLHGGGALRARVGAPAGAGPRLSGRGAAAGWVGGGGWGWEGVGGGGRGWVGVARLVRMVGGWFGLGKLEECLPIKGFAPPRQQQEWHPLSAPRGHPALPRAPPQCSALVLSGGIQRYLEAFPGGGFFRGKNFVFDERVEVPAGSSAGERVG